LRKQPFIKRLFDKVSITNINACEMGDCSGDGAAPWGSAIEERRLKPSHSVITPS